MFRSVCRVLPETSMTTVADQKSIDLPDLQRRTVQSRTSRRERFIQRI
jgi:hypothetical protein